MPGRQEAMSPFDEALGVIERLPDGDQQAVLEIMAQRLADRRRAEIAANARATLEAFREGRARYGTVDELRQDLAESA